MNPQNDIIRIEEYTDDIAAITICGGDCGS